jgi:hypothetical protein
MFEAEALETSSCVRGAWAVRSEGSIFGEIGPAALAGLLRAVYSARVSLASAIRG